MHPGNSMPTSLLDALGAIRREIRILTATCLVALAGGFLAVGAGRWDLASVIWTLGILPVLGSLVATIVTSLAKGDVGLDIIAALAMAGAILGGEPLAGIVVALMFSGGQALEDFAQGRAQAEMTALLGRVSQTAQAYRDGALVPEPIDALVPGDVILIRADDVVPVDGLVAAGEAILDESALTGEPGPIRRARGESVLSGVSNAGPPFDLEVAKRAADSTYAGIVRLVEAARLSKAPMARLADRYALVFLAATLLIAGAAWLLSGDPRRALAVLVVATPCPLNSCRSGRDCCGNVPLRRPRRHGQIGANHRNPAEDARPAPRQDRNSDGRLSGLAGRRAGRLD